MPRVVVVGDVMDDVIARPLGPIATDTDTPSIIERRAGGSAANTACWLAAAGAEVTFVGTVGHEDVDRHAADLAAYGVHAQLRACAEPTGSIVVISDGAVRTMLTSRGANAVTGPSDVDDALLAGADLLHITGHPLMDGDRDEGWRDLFERAARAGVRRSVDPGSAGLLANFGPARFRRMVAGVEVLLPNRDEAALLGGDEDPVRAADALAADHDLVVVTDGAEGALARSLDVTLRVPPVVATSVDVTGAGDAFAAGLLAGLVKGEPLEDSLAAAAALAARAVAIVGARPT